MINKNELELYFHIPFCMKKCLYCDFLSGPSDEVTRTAYMKALRAEARANATKAIGYEVVSVFIGGGTPSVVEATEIEQLLCTVRECYTLSPDCEITIEVNPGTVDSAKLLCYRNSGINRLSIGLQSAQDAELERIGRIHNRAQFLDTYRNASDAGFDNINVDLMSTLPGQSLASYRENLAFVTSLQPKPAHISAYSLILEEGTPLYDMVARGEAELPDEDLDREMYRETKEFLAKEGYHRYEISNYALSGRECRHNCGYWTGRAYLGFGVGAASCFENRRYNTIDAIENYISLIGASYFEPERLHRETMHLSEKDCMEEFMFLGLRLTAGIHKKEFEKRFGCSVQSVYEDVLEKNYAEGLLIEEDDRIRLTELGLDVSNHVFSQFLLEE